MSPLPPVVAAAPLGTLVVTGADRLKWLNGLVTCDLVKMDRGAYGFATSKVGRVLTDVVVLAAGDRLLVGVAEGRAAALRDELERFLIMEDAEVADASAEHAWFLAYGDAPKVLELGEGAGARLPLGPDGGAALCVPAADAARIAGLLGAGDRDDLARARLARGVPTFGVDFDDKAYPQESGIDARAVSFTKGCYLGQEVVCRLEMRGHVHRKLVTLDLDGPAPPPGAEVRAGDTPVGQVTSSAAFDGKARAIAMIKHASSAPDTRVLVDGREARVSSVA